MDNNYAFDNPENNSNKIKNKHNQKTNSSMNNNKNLKINKTKSSENNPSNTRYLFPNNNSETNLIFETIWAYDYFKNLNCEKQNFKKFINRFCYESKINKINSAEKNFIEYFVNSDFNLNYNNKNLRKIKQSRCLMNKRKRKIEENLISIKSKLHKNEIVFNELLSIRENQSFTARKIEKLLFLFENESQINSRNFLNNNLKNNDFINFNLNNNENINNKNNNANNFFNEFPYLNIPGKAAFAQQQNKYINDLHVSENKINNNNNFLKSENLNNNNLKNTLNNPNLNNIYNNNEEEEHYGYLNTEEANNNSNYLNKNFLLTEKQVTQKPLTNTFSNNSHIYDYFSFRIRNSKLNNSNNALINSMNSDINGSAISNAFNNTNENLSSRKNQRLNNINGNYGIGSNKNFDLGKNNKNKISINSRNNKENIYSNNSSDSDNLNKNLNQNREDDYGKKNFSNNNNYSKNNSVNSNNNKYPNKIQNEINNNNKNFNKENSNTPKILNFSTSRNFNSFILSSNTNTTNKHSLEVKPKKQAKLNETFSNFANCNFNKADFSLINQGLSDTFDFGLSKFNNENFKKSHSPDNKFLSDFNPKFFEDTDSFNFFNSYRNNLKLTNTNTNNFTNLNYLKGNLENQNFVNAPQSFLEASSKDATKKLFELTSNPFDFGMENAGNGNGLKNKELNRKSSEKIDNFDDFKNKNSIEQINNEIISNNQVNNVTNKNLDERFNFSSDKLKLRNYDNLKHSLDLSKNLLINNNNRILNNANIENANSFNNNNNKNNLENTATEEIKVLSSANKLGSAALNMNNQTLRRFKLSGFDDLGKSALNENENDKVDSEKEKEKEKIKDTEEENDKLRLEDLNSNNNINNNSNSNYVIGENNSDQNLNLFNRFRNKILNKSINNNIDNNLKRKDSQNENQEEKTQNKSNNKELSNPYHKQNSQNSNMEIDLFTIQDNKRINNSNNNSNNNFQKLKFNNFTRNERVSGNSPILSKKRNERIESINSLSNNELKENSINNNYIDNNIFKNEIETENKNMSSKNEIQPQNKNKSKFEFNYIRKNLEILNENSLSAKEKSASSIANVSGLDVVENKKDNAGNSRINLDNSLVNSTNTDNVVLSRKSQDKSLVSGSDVMYDNYSQNSGKFLIDSKDKFKKVRGFNFKNNINTRKFNKPLLSSNQLTNSTNNNNNSINENLTASQSSPKKPFQAKEKLLSLSSNKETVKREINSEKNKDEISLKNPSSRFNNNLNQQSIDMDANSFNEFVNKDKLKKSNKDRENLVIEDKDDSELEDKLAEKKISFLDIKDKNSNSNVKNRSHIINN